MTTEISDEEQRRQVVIAIMSCNFSNYVISEGCKLASCTLKPRVLTKYGYMSTRKRDFRSSKAKSNAKKNTVNDVAEQLESNLGKAAYSAIETEPSSYLKDFKNTVFTEVLQSVNKDHIDYNNFKNIIKLDLNGQLIGNSGLDKLSKQMVKSPVEILVLTENDIDDDGIFEFAITFKTLPNLKELYLNSNKISDVGVEALFNPYNYSKSLQLINLARNPIGRKSAFFLGSMFTTSRLSKLESVLIGDRMGKNLGDDFLKVFIALLTTNSARPLKRFACPSAGLTEVGIMILATLLLCNCGIEELNMTRNAIVNPIAKRMFLLALQANSQLTSLHLHQCALSSKDIEKFENARKHKTTNLLWHESTFLATSVARQLSECDRLRMEVEMSTYVKPPVEKIDRMLTRTIGAAKAGPSRWRPSDSDRLRETRMNRDKIPIRVHPLFHEYSPPLTASILVAAIEATMLMNASITNTNRTNADMVDTIASANQSQQQQQLQPPIPPPISNTTATSLPGISHDLSVIRAPSPQRRIMISKNYPKISVSLATPSNHLLLPSPDTRPFLSEKSTSIPMDYYPIRRSSINFIANNFNIGNPTGRRSPTIRVVKDSQPMSASKHSLQGTGNESAKGNSGTTVYSKINNPSPSSKLTTMVEESSNENMDNKTLTITTGKSDSKYSSDSMQDTRDLQQQQQQQPPVDTSPTSKARRDQIPSRNLFTVKPPASPRSVPSEEHSNDSPSKNRGNHPSSHVGESTPPSLSSVCEEGPLPSLAGSTALSASVSLSAVRIEDSCDQTSPIKLQSNFISQIEGGVVTFSPALIKALSTCDSLIPWVNEMECALTQTMVECMREVTLGAEGKSIIKEVKGICTRRRNASRKSKSQMQITLNKLQSQMKSKVNARGPGPPRTIVRQSSILNREHTVELESLLIIIEDYVSSLLEQSTACERGIASIHKLRIDSFNQLSRPQPPLKYSIWMPYTSTLSYAAYFNHYINIARPSSSSVRIKNTDKALNYDFNSLGSALTSVPSIPIESESLKKRNRLKKVMEKNKLMLQAEETQHHRVTREVDNKETNHRIYGLLTDNTFHIVTARKSPAVPLPPIPPRPLGNLSDSLQHDPLFANLENKMSVFTRNLTPMKSPPSASEVSAADNVMVPPNLQIKQNSGSSSYLSDLDRKPKSKQYLRMPLSRDALSQSQSGRDLQARFTPALPDDANTDDADDDVTDMTDSEAFDLFFAAAGNIGPIYAPTGGLGEVERPINSAENWLGKKEEDVTRNIREGLLSVYIKPKIQHEGSITHHDSDETFETSATGRSNRRYLIRAGSVVHRAVMLEQEEERGEALPVELKRNYFRKNLRLNDRFGRKLKKRIEFYKYSDTDFIAQQRLEIVRNGALAS